MSEKSQAQEALLLAVPDNTWEWCGAPEDVVRVAVENAAEGVPTRIANHPVLGWVALIVCVDGPYIVWPREKRTRVW